MKEKRLLISLLFCSFMCLAAFLVWINSLGRETWRVIFSSLGLLGFLLITFLFYQNIRKRK